MKHQIYLLILFVFISTKFIDGAKILAVVPFAARSHHNFIQPIIKELGSRGHDITFYTALTMGKNETNIKEIMIADVIQTSGIGKLNFKSIRKFGGVPIFGVSSFWFMGLGIGKAAFEDPKLQKLIHSDEKFDLILLELFFCQEALVGFGHKFNAPVVALQPFTTYFHTDEFIGNPFGTAYLPSIELQYSDKMTFFQRVHNTIRLFLNIIGMHLYYLPRVENLLNQYLNYSGAETRLPVSEMLQNVALIITNSQISVDYPRPWVPNVIGIAGVHISPKRNPLPQDLKEFMDNSKHGVVYFSFGSVVPSEDMPEDMKNAFIKAFGKIKQNVLWKLPGDPFPGLPKNVKISGWLPQHDILAHPKCLAFITHGGLLSHTEAVYFGVPLIGVPFFGDQPYNVHRAVHRGFGIHLDQYNITEESVLWAVNEILNKPLYRENVKRYSQIFHDNPKPPLETAGYWVDYILKYKGAPHLRSEGRSLPYIKYLLIDVILFISLILFLILFSFYKIVKLIFSTICGGKQTKPIVKSGKKKN